MPPATKSGLVLLEDTFITNAPTRAHWDLLAESVEDEKLPSGKVDGNIILARLVCLDAFLINGVSDNNRLYKRELWERQQELKRAELESGGIFGAFGHDQPLGAKELGQGLASHLVTEFKITPDNRGKVEFLVLGTPTGTNLNIYVRSGKAMAISTRGYGQIIDVLASGVQVVDPKTYYLETVDVVKIPGAPNAYLELMEEKITVPVAADVPNLGVKRMDETTKLLQLNEEKTRAVCELSEQVKTNASLTVELNEAKQTVAAYQKHGDLQSLQRINEGLLKWLAFEPFKKFAAETNMFGGSVFNAGGTLERLSPIVEEYTSMGAPEVIKAKLSKLAEYEKHGTPETFKQISESALEYSAIGKPAALKNLVSSLKNVKMRLMESKREKLAAEVTTHLSKIFENVEPGVIGSLVRNTKTKSALLSTLKTLNESAPTRATVQPTTTKPVQSQAPVKAPITGSSATQPLNEGVVTQPQGSLQKRLYESMTARR